LNCPCVRSSTKWPCIGVPIVSVYASDLRLRGFVTAIASSMPQIAIAVAMTRTTIAFEEVERTALSFLARFNEGLPALNQRDVDQCATTEGSAGAFICVKTSLHHYISVV
jgi:hypothetical protein